MENPPLYSTRIIKFFVEYINTHYPDIHLEPILDYAGMKRYQIDDEGHWFSQGQVDRFYERLVIETGDADIAREAGRYSALSKSGLAAQQYALSFVTPVAALSVMEKLYPIFSRACTVSAKKLASNKMELTVKPGPDVDEKPYQCENRMGIFESIPKLFTGEYAKIEHPECLHKNADACRYIISWEQPAFLLWKRLRNYATVFSVLICAILLFSHTPINTLIVALLCTILVTSLHAHAVYLEKSEIQTSIINKGDLAGDLLERVNTSYDNALLIQEVGQATASILDMDKLLPYIMELLGKRLDFDRGMIMLANEERTRLVYVAGFGYNAEQEEFLRMISFHLDKPSSRGQFVLSFKNQIPFLINDIEEIETIISKKSLDFVRAMGVQSFICVPIIFEGRSEGVLGVDNIRSKRQLSQSDLNLLMGIAPQVGISINNARSYRKIKNSEARFRALGENSPDIIYTLDADSVITYINPVSERILLYSTEELIGKRLLDIICEEDRPYLTKVLSRAKNREIFKDVTGRFIDKQGKEHVFNISGAPNFDDDGRMTGLVGSLKDVSELKKNYDILQMTLQSTIDAMSEIVESRDPYTAGHQKRVALIAGAIGEEMNLPLDTVKGIQMASMIHDIGKMYVPAEILSKPIELNDLEFTLIKTHPEVGFNILKNIEFTHPVARIVLQHHERLDGSGYPNGISGEDILMEAKILSVADVVEAMSSHRPYRPALGIEMAIKEITENRGILYDSDVVDACIRLFTENKFDDLVKSRNTRADGAAL